MKLNLKPVVKYMALISDPTLDSRVITKSYSLENLSFLINYKIRRYESR